MSDLHDSGDIGPAEVVIGTVLAQGASQAVHGHERLSACPNCNNAFAAEAPAPNFCPVCGQEAVIHPPSVAEFAHEFVGHYVAVDGPLRRTLWLLLARPGQLTREYLLGRRRRYVLPLRLYLSASFLFFLAFRLLPGDDATKVASNVPGRAISGAASAPAASGAVSFSLQATASAASGPAREIRTAIRTATAAARARMASSPALAASAREARLARLDQLDELDDDELEGAAASGALVFPDAVGDTRPFDCDVDHGSACSWLREKFERVNHRWRADPERARADFSALWLGSAPYAVFLMQPVFAGLIGLAYRRRHMLFGEHLVFAMHLHAFWFLAALLTLLLPEGVGWLVMLGVIAYNLMAMRRVYEGRWGATVARAAFVSTIYGVLLGVASGAITLITLIAVMHG